MYLRDKALAEDATQETFLKAYKALPALRGDSSEKTWLMRIAMNTCRDITRSNYNAVPYTDENGDMIYIIRVFSGTPDMVGQRMTITLNDLGVYADKKGTYEVKVPGSWIFECELQGTKHSRKLDDLNLDIGDSGPHITQVYLSPIHIQMTMNAAASLCEYEQHEDGESLVPNFRGVKMTDGTRYELIAEAGEGGYISEEPNSHEYQMLHTLNRIIEPSEVDALLFSYLDENGERKMVEVPLL